MLVNTCGKRSRRVMVRAARLIRLTTLAICILVICVPSGRSQDDGATVPDCCGESCSNSAVLENLREKFRLSCTSWDKQCQGVVVYRGFEFDPPVNCTPPVCGNDFCQQGENATNCPQDCGQATYPCPAPNYNSPGDPSFSSQRSSGSFLGSAGGSMYAQDAWIRGFDGSGIQVAVVDDGLQWRHPEIYCRYASNDSWNFQTGTADPDPFEQAYEFFWSFDGHGTACAGVVGASINGECGVGVAPNCSIAGIKLLSDYGFTRSEEAEALSFHLERNRIYSNSWGPADDGATLEQELNELSARVIRSAVRSRHKNIYVWAGGNGRDNGDYAGFDQWCNLPEVIAVGSVNREGGVAYYSESGACINFVAPGGDAGFDDGGVVSSDLRGEVGRTTDNCFDVGDGLQGTSFSCPSVAGAIAVLLSANSELDWRDVQRILAMTAIRNDREDPGWTRNGAGFYVNHKYGFGLLNISAAVSLATEWSGLPPERQCKAVTAVVNKSVPNANGDGVLSTVHLSKDVPGCWDNIAYLEQVVLTLRTSGKTGPLRVSLLSPDGTTSILAVPRSSDENDDGFDSWPFLSVRHLGESIYGEWQVRVSSPTGFANAFLEGFDLTFIGAANEESDGKHALHVRD